MAWTNFVAGSIAKASEVNNNFKYLMGGGYFFASGTDITNTEAFYLRGNQNISGVLINGDISSSTGSIYYEIIGSGFDTISVLKQSFSDIGQGNFITSSGNAIIFTSPFTDYFYIYNNSNCNSGASIGSFANAKPNCPAMVWTGSELLEAYELAPGSSMFYRHSGLSTTMNGSYFVNPLISLVPEIITYKTGSIILYTQTNEHLYCINPANGNLIGSTNISTEPLGNYNSIYFDEGINKLYLVKGIGVTVFNGLGSENCIGSFVNSDFGANALGITRTSDKKIFKNTDGQISEWYNATAIPLNFGSPVDLSFLASGGRINSNRLTGLKQLEVRYY